MVFHLFSHTQVIETSSMGNIPLHANLRNVLFWIDQYNWTCYIMVGWTTSILFILLYCPNYCRWHVIPRYNNTDIFVHCKKTECSKIIFSLNITFIVFLELNVQKWNKCLIEAQSEVIKTFWGYDLELSVFISFIS